MRLDYTFTLSTYRPFERNIYGVSVVRDNEQTESKNVPGVPEIESRNRFSNLKVVNDSTEDLSSSRLLRQPNVHSVDSQDSVELAYRRE